MEPDESYFPKREFDLFGYVNVSTLFIRDNRITSDDKVLLMTLKIYEQGKGACFPSISTLAKSFGVSRSTMKRRLDALAKIGFIEKEKRRASTGATISNAYLVEALRFVYSDPDDPCKVADCFITSMQERGIDVSRVVEFRKEKAKVVKDQDNKNIRVEKNNKCTGAALSVEQKRRREQMSYGLNEKDRLEKQGNEAVAKRSAKGRTGQKAKSSQHDTSKEMNAGDIQRAWYDSADNYFPNSRGMRVSWGKRDLTIAKKLCRDWGGDTVITAIDHIFEHWDYYKAYYSIDSIPTIRLFAGYASSWLEPISQGDLTLPEIKDISNKKVDLKKMVSEYNDEEDTPVIRSFK